MTATTARPEVPSASRQGRASVVVLAFGQVSTSGAALLVGLCLAQLLDSRAYGFYALLFACFLFAQGILLASAGESVLLAPSQERRSLASATGWLALVTTSVLAVAAGAGSVWLLGWGTGSALAAYAVTWPLATGLDLMRLHGRRRRRTAGVEAVAAAGVVGALVLLVLGHPVAALALLLAVQGCASAFAWHEVCRLGGESPAALWHRRGLFGPLALESVLVGGTTLLAVWGVALAAGVEDAGRLRAAGLILGITTPVVLSARIFALRRLSSTSSPGQRSSVAWKAAATSAVAVLVGSAVLFLSFPTLGELALGSNAEGVRQLLLPLGGQKALGAAAVVLVVWQRYRAGVARSVRARFAGTCLVAGATVAGAWAGGASGAAWAGLGASALMCIVLLALPAVRREETR